MAFCNICQNPATWIARIKPDCYGYREEIDVYRCDSCMSQERHVINTLPLPVQATEPAVSFAKKTTRKGRNKDQSVSTGLPAN